jgi:hypothetical protein
MSANDPKRTWAASTFLDVTFGDIDENQGQRVTLACATKGSNIRRWFSETIQSRNLWVVPHIGPVFVDTTARASLTRSRIDPLTPASAAASIFGSAQLSS